MQNQIKYFDNSTYKFNRYLLLLFACAPFVAYVMLGILNIDFVTVMQLLSYIGVISLFVFKPKNVTLKFPKYILFYLLFVLYVFHSAFIQLDRDFKVIYLFKNELIGGLNFMFIIENITITKRYYNLIIKISKYILLIAVLIILMQQAINPQIFMNPDFISEDFLKSDNDNRLYSIYSWLGNLQAVGFGFVPIFLLVIEDLDKKKKEILKWLLIGLTFALLSKARWIMVNAFLVFVILFINHRDKTIRFFKFLFFIPLIIYLSLFALKAVGIDAAGIVNERILEKDKANMKQTTAGTRLLAFEAFGKLFWNKPILGNGNKRYGMGGTGKQDLELRRILKGRSSQIHVGYLSLLYKYGIVGGFFFLGFLYLFLKQLYKNAKIVGIWAPFLGMMGLVLANLTLVHFSVMQMGFLIILIADKFYSQHRVLLGEI